LPRSDIARARRPKGVVAMFQYQISQYESAGPAEDHTLSLRRASRVSALKGGTGTSLSAGNADSKPRKITALSHPKCVWVGLDVLQSSGKWGTCNLFVLTPGPTIFKLPPEASTTA